MRLSDEALDALEADLQRLLEDANELREFLERHGRSVSGPQPAPVAAPRRNPSGHTGLRARVVDALRQVRPHGVRPRDLAAFLLQGGYRDSASTPLSYRVSNELSRMHKEGKLEKREGRYRLPDGEEG